MTEERWSSEVEKCSQAPTLSLTFGLLHEVVAPVAEVENGKDGGKDNPRDDVDLLGAGGEPIEPCLEEVVIPLLWLVHDDLASVQFPCTCIQHDLVAACTPAPRAAAA